MMRSDGLNLRIAPESAFAEPRRFAHQRLKQIRVEIADFALQDGGDAFEARAGIDRGFGRGLSVAGGVAIELHEDEIPDFDVAAAVAGEFAIGVALIGGRWPHVVVNFAARAAGAGVAHGPEIFLQAGNFDDAVFGRADLNPERGGFADRREVDCRTISAPPKTVK